MTCRAAIMGEGCSAGLASIIDGLVEAHDVSRLPAPKTLPALEPHALAQAQLKWVETGIACPWHESDAEREIKHVRAGHRSDGICPRCYFKEMGELP
jgi:hypothetical protein